MLENPSYSITELNRSLSTTQYLDWFKVVAFIQHKHILQPKCHIMKHAGNSSSVSPVAKKANKWLQLEAISGGHLIQLLKIVIRQLFSINKDGDSTTFLGKLYQCSVTPAVKKGFPFREFIGDSEGISYVSVLIASGPVAGHHWNESVLYALSLQILYTP